MIPAKALEPFPAGLAEARARFATTTSLESALMTLATVTALVPDLAARLADRDDDERDRRIGAASIARHMVAWRRAFEERCAAMGWDYMSAWDNPDPADGWYPAAPTLPANTAAVAA